MSAELWVTNMLKILFVAAGGHIAITRVIPMLENVLSGIIKDKKVMDGFVSLITVLVIVLVGLKAIEYIQAIGNRVIGYLAVVEPGFSVIFSLEYYFKWIIIGILVILGLKAYKS